MMQATVEATEGRGRVLDPVSRISEILFGLIMALGFTSTLSAATAGRDEVRTLMFAAIGCNVAWGLVDGVMFLVSALTERGREFVLARRVRDAATPEQAYALIGQALPSAVASAFTPDDYERLRQAVLRVPKVGNVARVTLEDVQGATAVFLLVVLSTFPVVLPFLLFSGLHVAIRVSNAIAIVLLFAGGYALGRYGGYSPWKTGLSMVVLGILLVSLTIALGG